MKKISTIELLTKENQEKALFLNRIKRSEYNQFLPKNNELINTGFLKIVEPVNDAQKAFCGKDHAMVQLSKKGLAFLKLTMSTEVV